jgi:hypothetical protein
LKLVLKGQPLLDSQGSALLQQGGAAVALADMHARSRALHKSTLNSACAHADSLLAILAPKAPPKHVQQQHDKDSGDADWERSDPARFALPANASPAKKRLVAFLRQRLRLPDVALVVLFGIRPWVWVAFLAWMIGAPIAHRLEVGSPPCCLACMQTGVLRVWLPLLTVRM